MTALMGGPRQPASEDPTERESARRALEARREVEPQREVRAELQAALQNPPVPSEAIPAKTPIGPRTS